MLTPKVIVITGVSSGIGRAAAEMLSKLGHQVFGTVRSISKTQPVPGVQLVEMDTCDDNSVQRAIQHIIDQAKRIDVFVNNAGVSLVGAVEETSVAEASSLLNTNVLGILRTTKAVLPHMRAQRSGRIVNVSSVLGFMPAPYMGVYAASKHAVEGLSESLDHEARQFGVRVVLVEPGFTKTNLGANSALVASMITAYYAERSRVLQSINESFSNAPGPEGVAETIIEAATGTWKMRRQPKGKASLLSKLRRFVPAGPFDSSLRKNFGLG